MENIRFPPISDWFRGLEHWTRVSFPPDESSSSNIEHTICTMQSRWLARCCGNSLQFICADTKPQVHHITCLHICMCYVCVHNCIEKARAMHIQQLKRIKIKRRYTIESEAKIRTRKPTAPTTNNEFDCFVYCLVVSVYCMICLFLNHSSLESVLLLFSSLFHFPSLSLCLSSCLSFTFLE